MSEQDPPAEHNLGGRLARAQEMIRVLDSELALADRGLLALTAELEDRAARLEQAEEKYRGIFENAAEGIYQSTPDGHLIVANPALATMLGYDSPDQLIESVQDIGEDLYVEPEQREDFAGRLGKENVVAGFEVRMRRRDGQIIWISLNARAIRDEAGNVVSFEGIAEDISDRRRSENMLRLRSAAMAASIDGMAIIEDEAYVYLNEAHAQIYGYESPDELVGRSWEMLYEQEELERFQREIMPALHGHGRWHGEARGRRRDGSTFPQELSLTMLGNGGLVCIVRDVTERKLIEDALHHSQKIEAVGRLAGGIAHDFNNVLTVVRGHTQMLLDELSESHPVREDLHEINEAAERATRLTGQLLAFSRKQTVEPEVVDIGAAVGGIERMLRRILRENVHFSIDIAAGAGRARIDPGRLEQILMNLVVNAGDAMPDGGRLRIRVEAAELTGLDPDTTADQPSKYVLLAVSDTGMGIDRETQERIFEPFFTTKEQGQGTGLGLATVYGIVKQAGGHIEVQSEIGRGTTFRIYLPRTEAESTAAKAKPAAAPAPARSATVLVAEDQDAIRTLARKILERDGHKVLEAQDGAEALRIANEYTDRIHLLITDMVMPGMSGRELANRVLEHRPGLNVLLMSGYTEDAGHRLDSGFQPILLEKPFTPSTLSEAVRSSLSSDG